MTGRVLRTARELSEADRAVLYVPFASDEWRIAAVEGWEASAVGQRVALPEAMRERGEPESIVGAPPGILLSQEQVQAIQANLRVPLVVGDVLVGVLVVSSLRKPHFSSGSAGLLKMVGDLIAAALVRFRAVDALRTEIDALKTDRADELQSARRARERELAGHLHVRQLPDRLPALPNLQFAAAYRPAPDLGCDAYSVIDLGDGHLGLLIADIAGRGWQAAVDMNVIGALVASETRRTRSPRDTLYHVNQALNDSGRDVLLTAFYGVYEAATRHLVFCRAGHPHPLWLRSDGQTVLLGSVGMALGMFSSEELDLAEGEIFLSPGDTLLLYTDGLTDAIDLNGSEFGVSHWVRRAEDNRHLPLDRLCAALIDEVAEFQSGATSLDDIALLAVRVSDT